jgi:hypothetical protein
VLTRKSGSLRSVLHSARSRYGAIPLPSLPSLKRALEHRVLRATSGQQHVRLRSHALRTVDRRVGGCFHLVSLSFPRFPASLRNAMVFCAVELARARRVNSLIIRKALWQEIIYIVGRYNSILSVENLNCLRRLLNRSREHNRIHSGTSHTCPLFGPPYQHRHPFTFRPSAKIEEERSQ